MSSVEPRRVVSLQLRLILALCGGLGALLVAMFFWLDHTIDGEIRGRLDRQLVDRARIVSALLGAPGTELASSDLLPEYAQLSHTDFFVVWDHRGRVLARSESSRDREFAPPPEAPHSQPVHYNVTMPDGHDGRAVAMRTQISVGGASRTAVVAVGQDRSETEDLERRIHYALLAGVVLTLLLATILAILAVRSGLRPLQKMGIRVAALSLEQAPIKALGDQVPRELRPFTRALDSAFARLFGILERERRFARDVAHELRTPLAEMRTTVELARRDESLATHPLLATAQLAVERMQRTVDGLLALVRHESGQTELLPEPVELVQLLREQQHSIEAQMQRRELGLSSQLPSEAWTQSDGALLERIIANLLQNAASYAPSGSVIHVRLAHDNGLMLYIGNAAPDLSEADMSHLGDRFWRKHPDIEPEQHGGLGLALTRALAQALQLPLEFRLADGALTACVGPFAKLQ